MTKNITIPFVRSGSYPLRAGNVVRLLVDGEPAFRRICEAIEAARSSVWVTVTFMWATFEMPDDRGAALDVLDRAAARGVDVRLIFWRPDAETEELKHNAFWGSVDHIVQLEVRGSGVRIRWDRAQPGFCQHQKSWLIDAGGESETAFVGGINLNPHSMAAPGHRGGGQNHDVYVELAGPSAVDVHHNFVQRWNEASERLAEDGRWGRGSETDLPFPTHVPAQRGNALVQIQRTMHRGRYTDGRPTPEGPSFDIASGERSIFDQYCAAIGAAQHSIYIENQYIEVPEIVTCLHHALRRGVEVVLLMPAEPEVSARPAAPERQSFFEARAALGAYEHFTLAGIAGLSADGRRTPVYVHAKLMLVDDVWATIGSCNLHRYSLFGNGEMNAAFWSPETVRALRCELFQEHLNQDTTRMDDRAGLQFFRKVALENRGRFNADNHGWQGQAFTLDPASYGR
ncbi:MAG TPA: phosphatidylserine/phosphatidylglycerophosphate/cardiolipin synthase family protein [Chloroflexota bacterium]|jgi:phosphatidylserine/phosphatidylglycerophosphate/cardiolipin synthase-like enzyme